MPKPQPLSPTPITPTITDPAIEDARLNEIRAARAAKGRQANILTGGAGVLGDAPTQAARILGG